MSRTVSAEVQNTNALVRAYQDEPVVLIARARVGEALELEVVESGNAVYFPADDVYRFSEDQFAALRAAFQSGDRERLAALWDKADRFDAF